ncbi:MAG: flagellar motor switch protein FliG [Dehalococcoidia bacterium]|jgi:flagellar motor switch protein FliG|nr:flagellar motor switch protein FliG [Dehalococcoidia bacterium]
MSTAVSAFAGARGRRRAAALLIAIGPESAAEILRELPDEDIGQLTWEIVGIGQLTASERQDILSHFYESAMGRDFVSVGGLEYAQDMLEKAVGRERADEITSKLGKHAGSKPFTFLQQVETKELVNFMRGEHPQAIALILAYLPSDKSSEILSSLPEEQQAEISVRIAMMERTAPEVIQEVEEAFRTRLGTIFSPRAELTNAGGIDSVVELLRKVDLATEKAILEGLEEADPDTANEIRKRMFVFENITLLDDRSIQRVLREVDGKDLGLALKGAMDEVRERILANMSERAARMLEEDMAALGPVRLKQVEEAQGRIVATIRRLEEAEEIFVMRGGEEEMLV